MTLTELYAKLPESKHGNIRVIGNQVIYDGGTAIYQAILDANDILIPLSKATKDWLNTLL